MILRILDTRRGGEKLKIEPVNVSYGIYFNTVLFPLTFYQLVNTLEKKGYEMTPELPSPTLPTRMIGTGDIARKGKTTIHLDASGQSLTVRDIAAKSALENFEEIVKLLIENYDVDINDFARFYSFAAAYVSPSEKKQPYENIAKSLRSPIFDEIGEVIGEKIWPFEIRFGHADIQVNSENWFDITLRPDYERNDSYVLNVVFRNIDRTKVEEFAGSFGEKMRKVISLVER